MAPPFGDPVEIEWSRAEVRRGLFGGDAVLRVGRFEVLGRLGAGAMGTVWRARDPELSREVAIKMLLGDGDGERLRREAQAMARLRHANVVAVYEIGTWRDTLFVAMERVEGPTVRAWLAERRRSVDEVLAVFAGAGSGLAAAHQAGLVHRDFKPDNLLVDSSGLARVADFGLARAHDGGPIAVDTGGADIALLETLTATGTRAGTPAYMAAEQLRGEPATARSDQFAFAVALFEALHGRRPFDGATGGELLAAIQRAALDDVRVDGAATGPISARVRRALARALAADPDVRHANMGALLTELAPPPRRTGWLVAGTVAVVAAAGGAWLVTRPERASQADLCGGGATELAGAWNPARAAEVRAAIAATGRPYATTVAERTAAILDEYAGRWVVMHHQSCEATRVHRTQPEDVLALRQACLSDRRLVLGALGAQLAHADAAMAEEAVRAASSLPSIERCGDVSALRARKPPPEDPAVAAKVAALRARLAVAKAAFLAGQPVEAITEARSIATEAEPLAYAPLKAEAFLLVGQANARGGDPTLAEPALALAYEEAIAGGDDVTAIDAATSVAFVVGFQQERFDEGTRWARLADAQLRRTGDDPDQRAWLANSEASIAQAAGRYADAQAGFARAQAAWRALPGDHRLEIGGALQNEGNALSLAGKAAESLERLEAAAAIWKALLGDQHPLLAMLHGNLSTTLHRLDRIDESVAHARRALAIDGANHEAADHPDVGFSHGLLGTAYMAGSRWADAEVEFKEAERIFRATLGNDHPLVGSTLTNLGMAQTGTGRLDEAERNLLDSLARKIAGRGDKHPSLTTTLDTLGLIELRRKRASAALGYFKRSLAVGEPAYGATSSAIADTLIGIARAELELGHVAAAKAALARADAILGPGGKASAQFELERRQL